MHTRLLILFASLSLLSALAQADSGPVVTGPEPAPPVAHQPSGPSLLDPETLQPSVSSNAAVAAPDREGRTYRRARHSHRNSALSIGGQVGNLAVSLLMAVLVWRYYRRRIYPRSQRYLTFGPRFWTGTVDTCVMWPIGFAGVLLQNIALPAILFAVVIVVQNLAWLFYTVYMHAKYGQTYGKMACKVKVLDFKTEGPLSFGQALVREGIPMALSLGIVAYEVSLILSGELSQRQLAEGEFVNHKMFWLLAMLPMLWFVAEAITMLTNKKSRALHDFIAGTVVVRTNAIWED